VITVPQAEYDLIRNARIRKRLLVLPVRYGRSGIPGARRPCPVREGCVYKLRAASPYEEIRRRAEEQPSRARAVLWLMDHCDQTVRTLTITITSVERQQDQWLVRFGMGDKATNDESVFMGRGRDYTLIASASIDKTAPVMTPFAEDLQRAREKAREKRLSPQQEALARMRAETDLLLVAMTAMKDRNRLKLIRREIEKLDTKLSAERPVTISVSDRAESQWPVAVEDGPRPNGTDSVVSLESAA
jgi:hypothetical protein